MPNFSDRDLNDLLRIIDTNGNGVVEYDELHGTHSRDGEQMECIQLGTCFEVFILNTYS